MAPLFLFVLSLLIRAGFSKGGPYPPTFDCPMRALALQYAQYIQPWLSMDELQEIADALNGSPEKSPVNCTISPNDEGLLPYKVLRKHREPPSWKHNEIDADIIIYVDIVNGLDDAKINTPSKTKPFKSLEYALEYIRNMQQYSRDKMKKIILRKGRYYLQKTIQLTPNDSNLIITNYNKEHVDISGAVLLNCSWKLWKNGENGKDYYYCDNIPSNIASIPGLRVNGKRAIRARFPNADPEIDGFGSELTAKSWIPPVDPNPKPDIVIYPDEPFRNTSRGTFFQHYNLGIGGSCHQFVPNAGYWCSTQTQGGGASTYRIPTGFIYRNDTFPNGPYKNISTAVLQVWHPGHWSSWMFQIGEYDAISRSMIFSRGGYQGARGSSGGGELYIENVAEELDAPMEYYFDENERVLYYYNNISNATPDDLIFEATQLKILVNHTGTQSNPVSNVTLRGITFRDSAYTYMDDHGMPSGGDWALERQGAIYLDGCSDINIESNIFTRLDGNAISINRYNRNISIHKNEIVWNGDSAITSWGDTEGITFPEYVNDKTEMGWDGTNGNQPRFLNISGNYVHEIGVWEKQSSFYFQSKSCQNTIYGNIFYNGPRAGININDGFGGDSLFSANILFNTCRESGDHGPINTWGRQVYVTKVGDAKTASPNKAFDYFTLNFIIANYNAGYPIDNDDGSNYYDAHNNFLIYGTFGQKSYTGGHDNRHYNNIYGYIQSYCFDINQGNDYQLEGHIDWYFNNTCLLNDPIATKYGSWNCQPQMEQWPTLGNNVIYTSNDSNVNFIGLCGMNQTTFQSKYKYDLGTVVLKSANDTAIIQQAKELLFI